MARLQFKPTEQERRTVKTMAGLGFKQEDIAKVVGLRSDKTLRKHFREEITRGSIDARAQVSQTLYKMAISGKHLTATIFFLKTQAGWRETPTAENRPAPVPPFVVALEKKAA